MRNEGKRHSSIWILALNQIESLSEGWPWKVQNAVVNVWPVEWCMNDGRFENKASKWDRKNRGELVRFERLSLREGWPRGNRTPAGVQFIEFVQKLELEVQSRVSFRPSLHFCASVARLWVCNKPLLSPPYFQSIQTIPLLMYHLSFQTIALW